MSAPLLLMSQIQDALKAQQPEKAGALYQQLLEAVPATADELVAVADFLREGGYYAQAIGLLDAAIKKDRNHAEAWALKGYVQALAGKAEEGMRTAKKAFNTGRATAMCHVYLGYAALVARQLQQVATSCDAALKLDKESAEALLLTAIVRGRTGQLQEAEWIASSVITHRPIAEAFIARGELYRGMKRDAEALADAEKAIAVKPWLLDAWLLKVNLLYSHQQFAAALELLDYMKQFAASTRDLRVLTAACLTAVGRHAECAALLEKLVREYPDDHSLREGLGATYFQQGKAEEAAAVYRECLARRPDTEDALAGLGHALITLKRYEEASTLLQRAITLFPGKAYSQVLLSEALLLSGKQEEALKAIWIAARIAPDNPMVWQKFADVLEPIRFSAPDPGIEQDIMRCLAQPQVDKRALANTLISYLAHIPGMEQLCEQAWNGELNVVLTALRGGTALPVVAHPIVLQMMMGTIIPSSALERLHTVVRRCLLQAWHEGASLQGAQVEAYMHALACQSFLNEYVYEVSEAEYAMLAQLEAKVKSQVEPLELLLLAGYTPLYKLPFLESWVAARPLQGNAYWQALLQQQWHEPQREQQLRATIPAMTPIEDGVSKAVREQYEENPYPRWVTLPFCTPVSLHSMLGNVLPAVAAKKDWSVVEHPQVLVAGCGTGGHPLLCARQYMGSTVTAVDLSLASLSYAKRKSEELGIRNITFAQADILGLPAVGAQYDVVESVGVIHHMADPLKGWEALYQCLKPGGVLRLGLYSEAARQHVVACRDFIAARGYGQSADDIRHCRQELMRMPSGSIESNIVVSRDFYSLSNCRDLIFHVQEHRFTIPMIQRALQQFDMEFLGFIFEQKHLVQQMYLPHFPDDPMATSLENWEAFERRYPTTFAGMYNFFARKKAG